jgi:predicted DNA-binding protein (MmcQ/YjbR family)
MVSLATIALALPGAEQGIACAGTALESRTFQVKKKSFLFVSKGQARLKLDASASEARKLGFAVGANGWVTVPLDDLPPAVVIKRWIGESYSLVSRARGRSQATRAGTRKRR